MVDFHDRRRGRQAAFRLGGTHAWRKEHSLDSLVSKAHDFIARDQGLGNSDVRIAAVDPNLRHDPSVQPEVGYDPRVPTHLVHAYYTDPQLGPIHSTYGISTKRNYIRHLDSEPSYPGDEAPGQHD